MPHVSGQRQHDQQYTVFILRLPVVIAAVPAGSLPSALSLASSLSMPHILSAKMQTKHAGPTEIYKGNTTQASPNYCCYRLSYKHYQQETDRQKWEFFMSHP